MGLRAVLLAFVLAHLVLASGQDDSAGTVVSAEQGDEETDATESDTPDILGVLGDPNAESLEQPDIPQHVSGQVEEIEGGEEESQSPTIYVNLLSQGSAESWLQSLEQSISSGPFSLVTPLETSLGERPATAEAWDIVKRVKDAVAAAVSLERDVDSESAGDGSPVGRASRALVPDAQLVANVAGKGRGRERTTALGGGGSPLVGGQQRPQRRVRRSQFQVSVVE